MCWCGCAAKPACCQTGPCGAVWMTLPACEVITWLWWCMAAADWVIACDWAGTAVILLLAWFGKVPAAVVRFELWATVKCSCSGVDVAVVFVSVTGLAVLATWVWFCVDGLARGLMVVTAEPRGRSRGATDVLPPITGWLFERLEINRKINCIKHNCF